MYTECRRTRSLPNLTVAALSERPVGSNSTAGGHWCTSRSPDVSLRGAKRRGNLAVPGRITGKPSAKSQLPPRDCTPRALPHASRSGRHVGLRPPRNDKSGGPSSFYRRPADYAGAAPGGNSPPPTRCVRSARALGNSRVRMALAERHYRRNRCVPF